ncbi:hypothetical protein LINGRAPRIM_LOCUS1628 [Linum grandiflorum]
MTRSRIYSLSVSCLRTPKPSFFFSPISHFSSKPIKLGAEDLRSSLPESVGDRGMVHSRLQSDCLAGGERGNHRNLVDIHLRREG